MSLQFTRIAAKVEKWVVLFLYLGFARYLPRSISRFTGACAKAVRVSLCRRLLGSCGEGVNIERGAWFSFPDMITLGDYSDLGINCELHGEVHIGKHSFMGPHVIIWTTNHAFDRTDLPMMYQGSQPMQPVYIGDDVWLGTRVTILPGVRIGNGAIVGAGAVVAKDVPDWAIVVGNPARVIRYRKHDTTVRHEAI